MKNIVAIVAAIFLGLMSIVGVNNYVEQQRAELEGQMVSVVVAARQVPKGQKIAKQDLTTSSVPTTSVGRDVFRAEEWSSVVGLAAAITLSQARPISRADCVYEETHFSESLVPEGKRAITLPVTDNSGFCGMLTPADRIDILLSYNTPLETETELGMEAEMIGDHLVSNYMMTNVEILALDNRTTKGIFNGRPGETGLDYGYITIAVSPDEAKMITFAMATGAKTTFVLRNPNDRKGVDLTPVDQAWFPQMMKQLQQMDRKK